MQKNEGSTWKIPFRFPWAWLLVFYIPLSDWLAFQFDFPEEISSFPSFLFQYEKDQSMNNWLNHSGINAYISNGISYSIFPDNALCTLLENSKHKNILLK